MLLVWVFMRCFMAHQACNGMISTARMHAKVQSWTPGLPHGWKKKLHSKPCYPWAQRPIHAFLMYRQCSHIWHIPQGFPEASLHHMGWTRQSPPHAACHTANTGGCCDGNGHIEVNVTNFMQKHKIQTNVLCHVLKSPCSAQNKCILCVSILFYKWGWYWFLTRQRSLRCNRYIGDSQMQP